MAKDEYMFIELNWFPRGLVDRIRNLGCLVEEVGEPYAFAGPATIVYCPTKEQIELAAEIIGKYYFKRDKGEFPPEKFEIYKKVKELFF